MAVFARVNGGVKEGQFFGRDINFVLVALTGIHTNYTNIDSTFEKVVRALQMFGTMSLVGVPASGNAVFAMEGLQTGTTALNGTSIKTAVDTATSGNSTVTIYGTTTVTGISGTGFSV